MTGQNNGKERDHRNGKNENEHGNAGRNDCRSLGIRVILSDLFIYILCQLHKGHPDLFKAVMITASVKLVSAGIALLCEFPRLLQYLGAVGGYIGQFFLNGIELRLELRSNRRKIL